MKLRLLLTLVSAALLSACGNDNGDLPGDGGTSTGDTGGTPGCTVTAPTFTAIHTELLNTPTCNPANLCHGAPPAEADQPNSTEVYSAISYAATKDEVYAAMQDGTRNAEAAMTYPNYFVSGDPDNSYLYVKLTDADAPGEQGQMPPGVTLDPCIAEAVRTWIMNGAAND